MIKKTNKYQRKAIFVFLPLALGVAYSLVISVLFMPSYQASAAFKPGEGDSAQVPSATGSSSQKTTIPTPGPAASTQTEGSDTTSNSKKSTVNQTTLDWTLWLIGGSAALIVALGGTLWYIKKRR